MIHPESAPPPSPQKLVRWDKRCLWHPFTQQREWETNLHEDPLVVARASGVYLYDARGRKYLDGVASLWANLHGHRHPALDRAVRAQLAKVAHSTFLGLTHEPGILLARRLTAIAPRGLTRVFYSDNGSTAVEVALKMAFQYRSGKGRTRARFLALKNSYHGDTLGSVSVGGIDVFHKKFRPLLFPARFAPAPDCRTCPHNRKRGESKFQFYEYRGEKPKPGDRRLATGCLWQCLGGVDKILKRERAGAAAAVLEPIVQGASGIRVMPPGYLRGFADLCRKHGTPLILDEVATGFGRTGRMFACEHESVRPDLLCLAKGLSGGYLPLAATLAGEGIYRAFLGRYDEFKAFFHGHTYTANPLACAAGRASLEIFEREKVLAGLDAKIRALRGALEPLARFPYIGQIRQAGLMAGIEIVRDARSFQPFPPGLRIGKRVCMEARKHGVLVRPLGDVIVLMPPLSIAESGIRTLVAGVEAGMRAVCGDGK